MIIFASRRYKNRINFLELLRAGYTDYVYNTTAIAYAKKNGLSQEWLDKLEFSDKYWIDEESFTKYLKEINLKDKRYKRILTESVLLGSIDKHGFLQNAVILSDDAGQFNVMLHALCWVHAERALTRLMPLCEIQREAMDGVLDKFWLIYRRLKKYKERPSEKRKQVIEKCFDKLCAKKTIWASLDNALKRLKQNKPELLLVLDRPEIPLHNNLSENDIRTYVKKRKISSGTRSDLGRDCRDTFASLKKTCNKLGISFWEYLKDRTFKAGAIPKLSVLVQQAIADNA